MKRKAFWLSAAVIVGSLAVPSIALAVSAASDGQDVSASVSESHSCQQSAPIEVEFAPPQFEVSRGVHTVDQLNVSNIDRACSGRSMKITLVDTAGVMMQEATYTVNGDTLEAFFVPVSAELVADVAVVIY